MKKIETRTDRIADYLFNEMDMQEKDRFEEQVNADPQLMNSFKKYAEIRDYLKERLSYEEMTDDPGLDEARRLAEKYEELTPGENTRIKTHSPGYLRKSRRLLIPLLAAASVALAVWIIQTTSNTNSAGLYDKYYEPLNVVENVYRGEEGSALQNELENGLNLYQSKDYAGAEETFSELAISAPLDPLASLYLGLSKMENSKFEQAITIFNNHLIVFDKYAPEAEWYLGLCYIITGRSEEAVKELAELSDSGGYFGDKASDILRKLD